MKYIIIKADHNDADYMTNIHQISDEEIDLIKPIIEAIKQINPKSRQHNFPEGDYCHRPDNGELSAHQLYGHLPCFDLFRELVPHEEGNIHTIESIKIFEVSNEITLL